MDLTYNSELPNSELNRTFPDQWLGRFRKKAYLCSQISNTNMSNRIKTLEDLNHLLSPEYSFSMSWHRSGTTAEKLAWHLLEGLPFDLDIILKGTQDWNDDIDREALDYVERIDERYDAAFGFDNKELSEWLFTTPMEHLAAYTAHIVRRHEFNKVANYYDAAQDHYADYWREWDNYLCGEMAPREYILALKEHVDEVNNHIAEGKQMGLTMDEIVMHDCTWGLMPNHYDPDMIAASKDILKKAKKSLPKRPYIWSEVGKRVYAPKMLEFAANRLKESGVDIGYQKEYTTEQGYLLDFFSRLYWREAASRPEE